MPPFLLGESHGHAGVGMARLLGFCIAFLFASSVTAANIIDLGPSDYRNYGPSGSHTGAGIRSSFGQTVRIPPAGGSLSVTRNAVVPYGSVANGIRNFTRINPASLAASAAITALFLGLDWVFDDQLDSWMKEGVEPAPELTLGGWYRDHPSFGLWSTPQEYCSAHVPSNTTGGFGQYLYEYNGGLRTRTQNQVQCLYTQTTVWNDSRPDIVDHEWPGVILTPGITCTAPAVYDPALMTCGVPGFIDLDPSDWQRLENSLPSADPNTVAGAGRDVMRRQGAPLPGYHDQTMTGPSSVSGPDTTSTSTDPVTGDTIVTNTSTQTNISYGDTTITTTNTTTSTTYQNGQETGSTVTTETPGELPVSSGGGSDSIWPEFCDWATVVCDWLNWTREDPPPEQDLPALVDDDFYEEREISFGSKSCPEPYQVNLAPFMDTQVSVSFQPLCDFAGLIYYMVMAASYIIAAYISIGVARA